MDKSVLISIRPEWCELIFNSKKTFEVRKTFPKIQHPFKVYVYCTQPKRSLIGKIFDGDEICGETYHGKTAFITVDNISAGSRIYGKWGFIVGEFTCDYFKPVSIGGKYLDYVAPTEVPGTCLTDKQILDYLGSGKLGYMWHISQPVFYSSLKSLNEFWTPDKCPYATNEGCTYQYYCFRAGKSPRNESRCGRQLKRAPQSWCYVTHNEAPAFKQEGGV